MEAVYIIHTRESIRLEESVFKIGRTSQQDTKRFKSYPKGSVLMIQKAVKNSREVEEKNN